MRDDAEMKPPIPVRPRFLRPALLASGCLLTVAVGVVIAHEGHTPLPSKGATVDVKSGLIRLSDEARTALDVQTTDIGTASAPETILAYATLESPWSRHAFAVSRLPGRIVALHAKPGDRIEAQAVLAEVQSQELEALQLEIQTARTEAKLAEELVQALKDTNGTVPGRDIATAEVQLQQARNSLELAQVKWLALGLPQETLNALIAGTAKVTPTLPIRSPVAGTITHADLAIGKVVEPGEHLFEIVDLTTILARVGVLEKDVARVAVAQPVEVQLTAYPGERFRGSIASVGQYLDPVTHLNDVWVEFRNPAGTEPRLLPGMTGQARIELPTLGGTKSVPFTALVNDGVDRFVLVEEASAAGVSEYRKRSVDIVREEPNAVEVRSSELFPGDRVVTQGGHELGTFFAPGVLRLSPESTRTIGLKVEPVTVQSVETIVEIPAAVELPPERRSLATARLPGVISAIRVERGQRIQVGDILAEVFSLDLLKLQLELLQEQLAGDLASQQLAQLKDAKEAIPKRRLVEAEAALVSSVNRRDSLRRRLGLVGLSVDQLDALVKKRVVVLALPVRASVAGSVVSFDRVIGQSVRADETLFEIHDLVRPYIRGFISERELSRVRLGQSARVRLTGDPGVVLSGNVVRSGRTFEAASRTLSVWIELDSEATMPLRHNQLARVALVVESPATVLGVPLGAIVRDGTLTFVFVQTGDTFDRREVFLGASDDRFAEVKAGLKRGERIAVTAAAEMNTAWASIR